jgi:hypothetical protein
MICLAAAALVLLTAGAGQAAAPQDSRVETTTGVVAQTAPTPVVHQGGLPFSGLDLALLMAGGGPLLLIGVTLRRRHPKAAVKPASEETLTLA